MLTATLLMMGCANEQKAEQGNRQEDFDSTGLTAFSMVEKMNTTQQSRTTAEYDGSGLNFYWTNGDYLFIKDPAAPAASRFKRDTRNTITQLLAPNPNDPAAVKRAETAVFYFPGEYSLPQYNLRYTLSGTGDKVMIRPGQTQTRPNDASHLGLSGDFGIATAIRRGGKYEFELEHKASYATFLPFTADANTATFRIRQITVTANEPMAGTYSLDDAGNLSTPTGTSKIITLYVSYFPIPTNAADPKANAATMVIAPGTYTNFAVSYNLYHPNKGTTYTITKSYPSVTFTAGKNKKISCSLKAPEYNPEYYQWDAVVGQHLWKGYEAYQPKTYLAFNSAYAPLGPADPRFYNTAAFPAQATRNTQGAPNVNEALWYMQHGDARWDETTTYTIFGRPYKGGVWVKKLSVIAAEHPGINLHEKAPDGRDRRTDMTGLPNMDPNSMQDHFFYNNNSNLPTTLPADLSKYIFLPALGSYQSYPQKFTRFVFVGQYAQFWTSSTSPGVTNTLSSYGYPNELLVVNFGFSKKIQYVQRSSLRRVAYPVFNIDNEDVYTPFQ